MTGTDGLVNNFEFATFGKAWLQYDPDEYTGDEPNDYINWNSKCNLSNYDDDEENDNYEIDIVDLLIFIQDWLWQACWKDLEGPWMMGMAGMEMMSLDPAEAVQPVLTVEEQIAHAEESLVFLNNIKETLDEDDWEGLTESIEELVEELEESAEL